MPSLLIVEDEAVLRRTLELFLSRRGYEVAVAASIDEAEQRLGTRHFDGALLDVRLPDGNGLDLLDRVGRQRAVIMTSHPDGALLAERGVLHRLDKPLDLPETAHLLHRVLHGERPAGQEEEV